MDDRLASLLDGIIPTRGDLAGAGGLGLAPAVLQDAQASGRVRDLGAVLDRLPDDFNALDPVERDTCLHEVSGAVPSAFASVVNMVYTAYYTEPSVLTSLAERTPYRASPPGVRGYSLDPFDERLLERVRQRAPMWRRA